MINHLADIDDMLSQPVNVLILNTGDQKGPVLNRERLRADQNARAQFLGPTSDHGRGANCTVP